MKAIVYTHYGTPNVLQLQEVEKPTPLDNEILVRIHTSTVTPTDCAFLKADPFMVRLMNGFTKPKNTILGGLLAGEVEAVGKDVTRFKVGDQVFGSADTDFGTHAEYKCVPEDGIIAHKPENVTYEDVVGIPEAMTPLYFFQEMTNVQAGQKVLINGASGAVGSTGVMLAKYFGAEVTAVCSTEKVECVKALGPDKVIDYRKEDFTKSNTQYDVIFDAVGKSSFSRCKRIMANKGVYLSTVPSLGTALQVVKTSMMGTKKAKLGFAGLNQKQEDLQFVKELCEQGHLKAIVDRCYSLEEIAEAYRYVDQGRKMGNVVIRIV